MFSKVLIANRGEIACRIIRTCQRLGIRTAAVYSEADKGALHVRLADEAHRIGPAPSSSSYLRIDRIVSAAKKAKAEAVHPGYGFLSENPHFAEAVEAAGMKFVGPSAEIITQMGDKVMARQMAAKAGVPVIPGTDTAIENHEAPSAALDIGFPLLVKAADGGGGMGIRLIESKQELLSAMERAKSQAMTAFGSDRVYLERYLGDASHVEVQVLADHHGNAVHLHERDCSVQRRHQKVVEETPCVKISPELREQMTQAAVRLVQSIGYTNAGTVEFLATTSGEFFFLEMNTRLQVEHPITEMVTGLDLVELQLRVAAGEELPLQQKDIQHKGHAMEARIYPEEPATLLPTAGTVEHFEEPHGTHVRVDSALFPGYKVSSHYEPLMAKVIVWAEDREHAIAGMNTALAQFKVDGVTTNIPAIQRVLSHPVFTNAKYNTSFLERMLGAMNGGGTGKELIAAIAAALALAKDREVLEQPGRWKLQGRRQLMMGRFGSGVS
jgi:acetyl-CoA carboxylase biotin carboxylase subunit